MPESHIGDAPRVGSENDPIRQALFACQPLGDLTSRARLSGRAGPFQALADAASAAAEGRKDEAKGILRGILGMSPLETRVQLWAWSALRELGERPDAHAAGEVLGVVIEVAMQGGFDTLAAYQDGSARYLNFSGAAIFWDAPDGAVQRLCQTLISSVTPEAPRAAIRTNAALPKSGVHATLLTRAVMVTIANPSQAVMKPAQDLMLELIRRAQAGKG